MINFDLEEELNHQILKDKVDVSLFHQMIEVLRQLFVKKDYQKYFTDFLFYLKINHCHFW